jgi:hypothetical protein
MFILDYDLCEVKQNMSKIVKIRVRNDAGQPALTDNRHKKAIEECWGLAKRMGFAFVCATALPCLPLVADHHRIRQEGTVRGTDWAVFFIKFSFPLKRFAG